MPQEDFDGLVGSNAQRLRSALGLSQLDVAQAMKENGWSWHQQTVLRVEKGQRPLRLAEGLALADVLDVTLEQLCDTPISVDETALIAETVQRVREAQGRVLDEARLAEQVRYSAEHLLSGLLDGAGVNATFDRSSAAAVLALDLAVMVRDVVQRQRAILAAENTFDDELIQQSQVEMTRE